MASDERHPIWRLACEAFKIQGGTIHQIARELDVFNISDLILWPNELCYLLRPDGLWHAAVFISYDAIHLGPPRCECSARLIGHQAAGIITGLNPGRDLRAFAPKEERAKL